MLHVNREHRLPVLIDLTSAPGRTMVFTRTKHGAKALTRQLNKNGVTAVELHGNLSQGARTRNMEAFHSGKATALVATDIAARGIHVDDVALVVHADPPVEHKAYLHRSGRTARAGAEGTVITLMTDDQVRDVRALTRAAGISPNTTRIDGAAHPMLVQLAPGERVVVAGGIPVSEPQVQGGNSSGGGRNRGRSGAGNGGNRSRNGAKSGGATSSNGGQRSRRPSAGQGGGGSAPKSGAPKSGGRSGGRPAGSSSRGSGSHSAARFSTGR